MPYSQGKQLNRINSKAALVGGLLCFLPAITQAQEAFPYFSFSGYGTLGYALLDDPNAEYRTGEAQDGADKNGSFEVDSRIALQLDAVFNSEFSAAIQGIIREAEDGDAAPQLEWGFLRWLPTHNLEVRVGRMSLPVFSISDYREVGYSTVLLRPPEDVYSQIPLRRFDGADITLEANRNRTLLRWQVYTGVAREEIFEDLEPDAKNILGTSLWVERGPLRARLSYSRADMDVDSKNANVAAVSAGIAQAQAAVPALSAIADDFAGKRVPLEFTAIGLTLDFDRVFADLEFAQRRIDNWVSNVDSLSLAVGTRIGEWRPYAFVSALNEIDGDRRIDLPDNPAFTELEAGINAFYEPRDQNTFGLGARWDYSDRIALKGQIEQVSRDEIGISLLRGNADDGTDTGDDVTLVSFTIDFIF
ncbi:MAG: porin [Gammaproteobacteria bacterium]|nr:porin [Gammaproteobacteria bacterium]